METTLEAVSQYGFRIAGKEGWTNVDKKSKLDPKAFHAGDIVDLTLNAGGFVTDCVLQTAAPAKKPFTPGKAYGGYVESPEKSNKMARGAGLKAAAESQIVYNMVKDLSEEEALKKTLAVAQVFADYIEKGI